MNQSQRKPIAKLFLVISVLSIVISCASLPTDFERSDSHTLQNTENTKLGKDVVPLVNQHPDQSGFHVLNDGMDAFVARLALIESAEKSLDVQYYIWHDDYTGRALHNRLLHAANRGVRVRLLLDDLDTAGKEETLHIIDSHPNIEIRLFNPFADRDVRAADFVTDLSRVNHRMHNKSLTADNQATILGGRNIGDEYFEATEGVAFSDLDVLGIGPVVGEVSNAFDLYWNSQWAYPLAVFLQGKLIDESQLAEFQQKSDGYLEEAKQSKYANALKKTNIAKLSKLRELEYSWGRWFFVYDDPSKVGSSEVKKETHLAPTLVDAFDKTQKELIIVSPYFVPGYNLTKFLNERVKNGVRVRILTNSLAANDVPIVHAGYMRYRVDLVKGGVELYEYKPTAIVKNNKNKGSWTGSSGASLHAKSFGFDRQFIFVGSFNLDARSVALNTEMGVFVESPKYATMLGEAFDEKALINAYRIELNNDALEWVTLENGNEVRFDVEPETSFWTRFSTDFLSIFVIESQL